MYEYYGNLLHVLKVSSSFIPTISILQYCCLKTFGSKNCLLFGEVLVYNFKLKRHIELTEVSYINKDYIICC